MKSGLQLRLYSGEKEFVSDFLSENQISADYMYIEIIWTFKNNVIFADTIWISKPYLIFSSDVKPKARKLRLYENKKGKSLGSDSPF